MDSNRERCLEMFSGYQEREEYEDELYHVENEEDSSMSEPDSELEFQLYSQLHYCAEDQENLDQQQDHEGSGPTKVKPQNKGPQPTPGKQPSLPLPPPPEVIVIDSGPDTILISDTTEAEDSVCASKGRSTSRKKQRPSMTSCPPKRKASEDDEVVIVELESDDSSGSIPPFVADLDSHSEADSDVLENWMILGRGKEDGDQDIQLNLTVETNSDREDFVRPGGGPQNWAVSEKDREAQIFNKGGRSCRLSNRYYTNKAVTCHNCKRLGHLSKNCPTDKKLPCCSLCGLQGHFIKTCPSRHCSNCFLPGHTYDDCLERAYWHKCCHRCGMTGHFIDACPDIWRQYHITTRAGPPVKTPDQKAKSPAYCYNCSRRGHFGHECAERRMFNGTYPTLPFVSNYNSQWDIKRLEDRALKYVHDLQEAGLLERQEEAAAYTPQPQPPRKKQKRDPKSTLFPFTPSGRPPKRRIAHTPKHHPQTTPKGNAHTPVQKVAQLEGKKKSNNNKKKKSNVNKDVFIIDVDQDFPRGFPKSPHSRGTCTPPSAGKGRPAVLFSSGKSSERSNKKKNKVKKWERKAANSQKQHQASDENLFLIKQRRRRR